MPLSLCILYSLFLSLLGFQSRFADALLRELAGVTIAPERLYGLGTGLVLLYIFGPIDILWCIMFILHYVFSFLFIDKFVFTKLIFSQQSQGGSAKEASENARTPGADTTVKILCFQRLFYLIYPLLRWFMRN